MMDHRYNTAEGWDAAAESYALNTEFSTAYGNYCIDNAKVEEYILTSDATSFTFLDVAGGPGVLSMMLGKRLAALKEAGKLEGKEVKVIGSDISPKMVEQLTKRLVQEQSPVLSSIMVPRVLDGQALSLEDGSVDMGFSTFGLFLFPDRAQGFSELYRVLKEGGTAVVTSWKAPIGSGIFIILGEAMKRLAQQGQQPPHQHTSKPPLGDPEELEAEMKAAGFKNVHIAEQEREWTLSKELLLDFCKTNPFMHPMREKFSLNSLLDIVEQVFQEKFGENDATLPSSALIAIGHK